MAYVECARCGLTAYTAARWSSIDRCARCDDPLPRRPPIGTAISTRLQPWRREATNRQRSSNDIDLR